ncbi:MAG: hypothetical protein GEU96_03735 [Propionibacteriales bacterium]|nr:hypothetical protein [Propionibacteriales bacterium]
MVRPLVALALALVFAVAPTPAAQGEGTGGAAGGPASGDSSTVTLVTGDRVTLTPMSDGEPVVLFEPRAGADDGQRVGYSVHHDEGRVSVIPHDVATLVPDVLDPALFDVTGLVEMGYDDASRADLPLIVRRAPGVRTLTDQDGSLTPTQRLASIDATAAALDRETAGGFGAELARLGSATVTPQRTDRGDGRAVRRRRRQLRRARPQRPDDREPRHGGLGPHRRRGTCGRHPVDLLERGPDPRQFSAQARPGSAR